MVGERRFLPFHSLNFPTELILSDALEYHLWAFWWQPFKTLLQKGLTPLLSSGFKPLLVLCEITPLFIGLQEGFPLMLEAITEMVGKKFHQIRT